MPHEPDPRDRRARALVRRAALLTQGVPHEGGGCDRGRLEVELACADVESRLLERAHGRHEQEAAGPALDGACARLASALACLRTTARPDPRTTPETRTPGPRTHPRSPA